jgi:chorismate mutase/prephenate dehydrogenase
MNLDELRTALTDLGGQLVELVARRQALSEQVATVKRATGRATRDFGREREVILRGRNNASRLGVSPDLVESLLRQLIQSSLTTQEQARVAAQAHGSGKRALVIGGHGKMGGWFAEFLASQGFRVAIADPMGALPGFDSVRCSLHWTQQSRNAGKFGSHRYGAGQRDWSLLGEYTQR